MSKNINYLLIALSILLLSLIYSCSHNEEPEIYYCGLTSAISSDNKEVEIIKNAYYDSYKQNGLNCNSQYFAPGTSPAVILKSCKEAEDAILSSTVKFSGRYIYEVRSKDKCLYSKIWGVRQ